MDEMERLKDRQAFATKEAVRSGVIAFAKTAFVWVPVTLLLRQFSPFYIKSFSTSAKTAFAIMPPLLAFGVASETTASSLSNPDAFKKFLQRRKLAEIPSQLPFHQRLANSVLDHPFQWIAGIGTPAVAAIFMMKSQDAEISFSQRVMHTRVLGQFTVLMTLAGTMILHDYLLKHGRFLEPWEEKALQEHQQ